MQLKRVVITGIGAVSPFGHSTTDLMAGLLEGRSAVSRIEDYENIQGLRSRIGARVPKDELPIKTIPRKFRRTMSSLSIYAILACMEAIEQAALPPEELTGGQTGVCLGSTIGSPQALEEFFAEYLPESNLEQLKSTEFFKIMNHSAAANTVLALGMTGRAIAVSSACATSNQAIGVAYELIMAGRQERCLAGGTDELHPLTTSTFDIMNAASAGYNDSPTQSPRPFDSQRDGVVCSEGAGVVLLESLESAQARDANILGEIVGYATVSDPTNIANPDPNAMETCMKMALDDAGLKAGDIDYINAHATGTEHGDEAESEAIRRVFGDSTPVSSLKGHIGHTMAASGSLELIATLEMMRTSTIVPTRNLETVDPKCTGILHVQKTENADVNIILKNSFAFGGVNSSIVVRKYIND